MTNIYFDNNATTMLDPRIADHVHELSLAGVANPSSQHRSGRAALKILESAKQSILGSLDAPRTGMQSAQVIVTSGGTEANNLAILGHLAAKPGKCIVAATEHPSVIEAANKFSSPKHSCEILPVDESGLCDLDRLRHLLDEDADAYSIVSIMLGNNETGVIQDLAEVCKICSEYGIPVHSDIVQAVGKIPFSMIDTGVSAVSFTAHKIHGPVGVGALVTLRDFQLQPLLVGGGQQLALRPGTEQAIPASALAMAVGLTADARDAGGYDRLASLRDSFEALVCSKTNGQVIASTAPRLPHTSNIAFAGADRQALQMALDLRGLACSTGSACASGSSRPSPILVAMSIPDEVAGGSLRFSLSVNTTEQEVQQAAETVCETVNRLVPAASR
ncbi:MAG: cysteine desulfurase family protein [Aureliella sp.]